MTPDAPSLPGPVASLLEHVETATEILREERLDLMQGTYDRIEALGRRKAEILALLEGTIRDAPRTRETIAALRRLISDSRRNELILAAARDGVAQARRRIASVARARKGIVAYQEDGTMIACRPDRSDTDKSA